MILGIEPTIYARIVFGFLALGTATAVFWPLSANLIRKLRSRVTTGPIPIAVSKVQQQSFWNYAGFYEGRSDPRDAQLLSYGDVTIANTSTTKRVALDLRLKITSDDGINLSCDADLRGPFGMIFGEQVISKNGIISKASKMLVGTPNYYKSPVELDPQKITRKTLIFLFDLGFEDIRNKITMMMVNRHDLKFTLEIKDHISGHTVTIPIPGEYRG